MLLRIRIRLPDRPGALGQVARTLGAAGADVVQMAVLERDNGRAMDDFTVAWPAGAGLERLSDGLGSVPGVEIIGVWPTVEPQGVFPDAAVVGQVAAVPERGAEILADAVPALLSADWAGLAELTVDGDAVLVHTSVGGLVNAPGLGEGGPGLGGGAVELPLLAPLRPRAFTAPDGTQFAVCPLAGGTVALVVARTGAPPFHRTEVFRLEQLAGAADAVLAGARSGRSPV
ncbi:ACT domain-containing protein [Actinomadura pelletieri DSM 43383]|uniref:ACT domain-containing protein n=1 Tax=Actinomadura pelletieri DSM 43383 TaxID=1120940 RepID=A0A495QBW7_9ACTN|nr:ACT domain-containing protein [Actinomadura pelletieri]RKS69041.1 ACT domain-containing protein [Actinomadura pelletieri DSM 43383]